MSFSLRKCLKCGVLRSAGAFAAGRKRVCRLCVHATEKVCTKCKALLPIDAFPHNYASADTRMSRCRACAKSTWRKHQAATLVPSDGPDLERTRWAAMAAQKRDANAAYAYAGVSGGMVLAGYVAGGAA